MRLLTILIAALALAVAGCGDDKEDKSDSSDSSATPVGPKQEPTGAGGCQVAEAPKPKPDGGAEKPKGKLDPGTKYVIKFDTNCGSFSVALDQKAAPKTSASLVQLTEDGFYDGTIFHRIVPDFVIQGGDPTGTGQGGPGYSTVDPPPSDAAYTKGVVAMAKTEAEPPGTSGSQFYVVTGADAGLPPDYAIVGKVSEGQDVVDRIGKLGDASEQPTQTVVIEKATVEEG